MRSFLICLIITLCSFAGKCSEKVDFYWTDTPQQQAWKGEKINGRARINSSTDIRSARLRASALRSGCNKIGSSAVRVCFITDVIGDRFVPGYGQCGKRVPSDSTMIVVADRLGGEKKMSIASCKGQDIWIDVKIPRDAVPGVYEGSISVRTGIFRRTRIEYTVEVADETLPEPRDWEFDLNLWQNPFSVARYYGDELWSREHFEHMRPLMERLRDAGQKAITTSIIRHPWNGQTEDPFETMVTKTLNEDGTWSYDYSIFDKWVEFMMDLGIDERIDCFSILPWHMTFEYIDGASGELKELTAAATSEEFAGYWSSLVKDFAAHLREKGWFDRTMIALDERQPEEMTAAINLVRSAVPDFKFSLAGWYSDELAYEFDYLCISSTQEFPEDVRAIRRDKGMVSTYYVCCGERYPNTFIASDPDEAVWLGWYAFAHHFDGFLRWSYNSWTADPLDARFRSWTAGDCHIVYPEASSVRFEKLTEGIQDYEKARILCERWKKEGRAEKISALEEALKLFEISRLGSNGAAEGLDAAKAAIMDCRTGSR